MKTRIKAMCLHQEPSMQQAKSQAIPAKVSSSVVEANKANSQKQPIPLNLQALRHVGGGVRGPGTAW